MRVLLDARTFLWWLDDSEHLSPLAREVLAKGTNEIVWSAVSSWEVILRYALGEIGLPVTPGEFLADQMRLQRIESLPIRHSHAWHTADLPPHHADPFDRMLVAQSRVEGLPILTSDPALRLYDVEILW